MWMATASSDLAGGTALLGGLRLRGARGLTTSAGLLDLALHILGGLVLAKALQQRMAHGAAFGPLAEAHLGHALGTHPARLPAQRAGRSRIERALHLLDAFELAQQ